MGYKFNPLPREFDYFKTVKNFSVREVALGNTVTVPERQEMLLKSNLMNRGILRNLGLIRIIKDDDQQMSHWHLIPEGAVVLVPENRTMFFKNILRVNGILRNQGIVEAT